MNYKLNYMCLKRGVSLILGHGVDYKQGNAYIVGEGRKILSFKVTVVSSGLVMLSSLLRNSSSCQLCTFCRLHYIVH